MLQILLLSGPPGLGKTTLAHVVARQAGYNVLEINARCAGADTIQVLELTSSQRCENGTGGRRQDTTRSGGWLCNWLFQASARGYR